MISDSIVKKVELQNRIHKIIQVSKNYDLLQQGLHNTILLKYWLVIQITIADIWITS